MDREGEFALLVGADLAIDLVERFGVPAHRLDRERDIDVARIRYRLAGIERFHQRQGSEEHTSELQSLMRISYSVFFLKTKKSKTNHTPMHYLPSRIHTYNTKLY